ncbi:ethylbenzene dehydrogenase-related protein [Haloarcula salinisoli]|uniref:DMSO reductase n=1 Tax=Haloarcula salinisoli TaxID=2487746 RepID=A0A8J7YA21_9EURY|nr:ethylbenzene dehydrogenase-related protein [Halomicroarcula salinisoli]MBX0286362.1 DMSO reductase [Halomicroarcula salinisoli]MBX0302150.1 DMSO reductase [Halomicroarcula salinisoli]
MADRRQLRPVVVGIGLTALVVLAALSVPQAAARPAHEIPVEPATGDFSGPTADGWSDVPQSTVPLSSAPSSVPNANDTTIERVHVQAARGEEQLYLRLQWHDATRDTTTDGPRTFADSVAVQFPVNESARPPIAMGGPTNRVNVWYWSGGTGSEELLAGGAGSTTRMANSTITTNATYQGSGENATWTVQYTRDLDVAGENRTTIPEDEDIDVAFAVWNGSNDERAGQKAVSEWHYFPFSGGPQGPPYAALLWTIAGVAIVSVIAVTAYGIRRTGEGMS